MDKKKFVEHLSENDGLDRGGAIRTAADENGNVFIFSENKYKCPVIDVLVEGKDKETLYFRAEEGEVFVQEKTGKILEETDPREAATYGRYYDETISVKRKVPDAMTMQVVKGNETMGTYTIGHAGSARKSEREKYGNLIWESDIRSYLSDRINVSLMKKAVEALNNPESFAKRVEKTKEDRKAAGVTEERNEEIKNNFIRTVRDGNRDF